MDFPILLPVGGVIGWLAFLLKKDDAQQGVLLDVVLGVLRRRSSI
jgi:uncharacterized membrane protein YeaQ/YmgE (transglycosylase-associated protein family)